MTTVTVLKKDGLYTGFTFNGHSDYAEEGSDIVCAAISVLVINCINSIETFVGDSFELYQDDEDGFLDFKFKNIASDRSQLLIDSMVLGLREIRQENKEYIKLDFKEV